MTAFGSPRRLCPIPSSPRGRRGGRATERPSWPSGPIRATVTDLAATQRYLYGVFSGRRVDEDGPVWASREVQVYTWDGAYVKTLYLDRAAEAIAIDASDTWLYASGAGAHAMDRPFPAAGAPGMTTTISFADWVDWLAIELTFTQLYESAPTALKHEMTTTVRRLARGIGEPELDAFASQVPNFERALSSFPGRGTEPLCSSAEHDRTGPSLRQEFRRPGLRAEEATLLSRVASLLGRSWAVPARMRPALAANR